MNPYELLHPRGKPCGVYVCGKCNLVRSKDLAEKCCQPCKCGKESMNQFQAECRECYSSRLANLAKERLKKAEEIEWDGEMMLLSEDLPNSRDGWYDSPEHVAEEIERRQEDDTDFESPEFVFASEKRIKGIDLGMAIDSMLEGTYEDVDYPSKESIADLEKCVAEFNAKNSITYFQPDYKHKIRIPSKE